MFLDEKEPSFHGHNKYPDFVNQGIYVELVKFIKSTDKECDIYFHNATLFSTISNHIHYNLIQCISDVLTTEIKKGNNGCTIPCNNTWWNYGCYK